MVWLCRSLAVRSMDLWVRLPDEPISPFLRLVERRNASYVVTVSKTWLEPQVLVTIAKWYVQKAVVRFAEDTKPVRNVFESIRIEAILMARMQSNSNTWIVVPPVVFAERRRDRWRRR